MCALFGWLDYHGKISPKVLHKLTQALANAAEERGTDASGISYVRDGKITIYKRPKPAHKMKFRVPAGTSALMGHTRFTTQGNQKHNYNNHPFYGKAGDLPFSLAHNGMLMNDDELKKKYRLPETNIETDSYVAVQLLEKQTDLSFENMAKVAEELEGSFTFSLLDKANNVYFIKGNNPLCIYYWRERNLYIYASTEDILKSALRRMPDQFGIPERVWIHEGDMMKITPDGVRETAQFSIQKLCTHKNYEYLYRFYFDDFDCEETAEGRTYESILKSLAPTFGYTAEDVDMLHGEGLTWWEIESFFYEGVYC